MNTNTIELSNRQIDLVRHALQTMIDVTKLVSIENIDFENEYQQVIEQLNQTKITKDNFLKYPSEYILHNSINPKTDTTKLGKPDDLYVEQLKCLYGKQLKKSLDLHELDKISDERCFLIYLEPTKSLILTQLKETNNAIIVGHEYVVPCSNYYTFDDVVTGVRYALYMDRPIESIPEQLCNHTLESKIETCEKNDYQCALEKYLARKFPNRIIDAKHNIVEVSIKNGVHTFLVFWPENGWCESEKGPSMHFMRLKTEDVNSKRLLLEKSAHVDADRETFILLVGVLRVIACECDSRRNQYF